jgi:hypothetical protein
MTALESRWRFVQAEALELTVSYPILPGDVDCQTFGDGKGTVEWRLQRGASGSRSPVK